MVDPRALSLLDAHQALRQAQGHLQDVRARHGSLSARLAAREAVGAAEATARALEAPLVEEARAAGGVLTLSLGAGNVIEIRVA